MVSQLRKLLSALYIQTFRVWKHWRIENGTFVSMEMLHGDICLGTQERQISV